jgi:hypothetical protein
VKPLDDAALNLTLIATACLPIYMWVRGAAAMAVFLWRHRSRSFSFSQNLTNQTFVMFAKRAMYSEVFLTDDQRAVLADWIPVRRRLILFLLSLPISLIIGLVVAVSLQLLIFAFDKFKLIWI